MKQELKDSHLEEVFLCPICDGKGKLLYEGLPDRLVSDNSWTWAFGICEECEHVWLTPRLKREHIIHAYENYSEKHWDETGELFSAKWKRIFKKAYFAVAYGYFSNLSVWYKLVGYLVYLHPTLRERLDRQVRYLDVHHRGKLLDIGSGSGWFLQNMQWLGWQVEGVDIDPDSVKKALKRNVQVYLGHLEEQDYPDNTFSAITMFHVIEHLHEPLKVLKECYRILRPGGLLVLVTPNVKSRGHKRFCKNWQPLEVPRHLNLFNMGSMTIALQKVGFEISKLTSLATGTGLVWYKSLMIGRLGTYQTKQQIKSPLGFESYFATFLARIWQGINDKLGEEILVICRKPPA